MDLKKFNSEQFIAHYTSFDRVFKNILPLNEIRVSSVSNVNDPYEKDKYWVDTEACFSKEDSIESNKIINELKKNIYSHIKMFCTTSYSKDSENCCDLSLDIYGKPRMWATYGDNHKGICLIFDKEELSHEFEKINPIKIYEENMVYMDYLPLIENSVLISLDSLNNMKIKQNKYNAKLLYEELDKNYLLKSKYFSKHSDWKSENEYRWLIFSENIKDLNINFGDSLKAIVFGVDTDIDYKCLLSKYKIPIFKLKFEYGKYDYIKIG